MHRHHATRPQTDAWLAAGDFDRIGSEVAKLTRLLEVLDEIAIAGAPSLDATPATWERYIERVSAVTSSTLLFSGGVERLAADCAGKLRAAGSTTDGQSWAPRHAA